MHQCPGPSCTVMIDVNLLACRDHWFQVPQQLRNEVFRTYDERRRQRGTEHSAAAIAAHQDAMDAAVATMRAL